MSDMHSTRKTITRVKIVPRQSPNDDGNWIVLKEPLQMPRSTRWEDFAKLVEPLIPKGWFVVQYE